MKQQIADYFAGIIPIKIYAHEQRAHDRLVTVVRNKTEIMLRLEAKRICKEITNDRLDNNKAGILTVPNSCCMG